MTNREAYVFGWVFGRLNAAAYPQEIGGDLTLAAQRPYTALARVISDAHRLGLLKRDLDRQVAEALCEITSIDPPVEGGSEKFQPLEMQGAWQLGYFAGKGKRPLASVEFDISAAHEKGLLSGDLDQQIGEALSEINSIEPEMDGGSEKVQPLEIQGSWQLGYYAGKGKRLLADAGFDIAAARKAKKLTQAQLADAMGVDQAVISRWESGKVSPNAENLAKLKELLG